MSFSKHENCEAVSLSYSVEKKKVQALPEIKAYTLCFVFCCTYYTSVIYYFTRRLHELLRYNIK